MAARTWKPDGPGSFRSPSGVTHVSDRHGRKWTRYRARWTANRKHFIRWRDLVAEHGPLAEAD
jgi:hypothetical protein